MIYIVGNTGTLANLLRGKIDSSLISSVDIDKIPANSKVVYTSCLKKNRSFHKINPDKIVKDGVLHLNNVLNLLERKCKVFYLGSDQGLVKNDEVYFDGTMYGLNKSMYSLWANFYHDSKSGLVNLVVPSIIGVPITNSSQIFEELVYQAVNEKQKFITKFYNRNQYPTNKKNLVTLDYFLFQVEEILISSRSLVGNHEIKNSFAVSVKEIYEGIHRVCCINEEPLNSFHEYIYQYKKSVLDS